MRDHTRIALAAGVLAACGVATPAAGAIQGDVLAGGGGPIPLSQDSAATGAPAAGEVVPGELIVRFRSGVFASQRANVRREAGVRARQDLLLPGLQLVRVPAGESLRDAIAELEAQGEVLYAEPNRYAEYTATTDDPKLGLQYTLNNTGGVYNGLTGTAGADSKIQTAWDIATGSSDVVIGIADSGYVYTHEDLSPNEWRNPGETGDGKETNGVDDDGNGKVDDHRGFDFGDNDNDPDDKKVGHGTHVAGIVGAKGDNGIGTSGVNQTVQLMNLRLGDTPTDAAQAAAIAYARDKGARIINMSLGGAQEGQAVKDAIAASPNVLIVAAAGNETTNVDQTPQFPCATELANILCIAATDQNDGLAGYSNFGATKVDMGAPGSDIMAPYIENLAFHEGFETDVSGTWTKQADAGDSAWATTDARKHTGAKSVTDSPGVPYEQGSVTFLRSPKLDLSNASECTVKYQMHLNMAAEDAFGLQVSEDPNFASGHRVDLWAHTQAFTAGFLGNVATGNEHQQTLNTLNRLAEPNFGKLPAGYAGKSEVYIRFELWDRQNDGQQEDGAHADGVELLCKPNSYSGAGAPYNFLSGTSMATPNTAGVAGLMLARNPDLTPTQLKDTLMSTGDAVGALSGKTVSGKRLNAQAALNATPLPAPPAPPPAAPASAPAPAPTPAPTIIPATFTAAKGGLKPDKKGRTVKLKVSCPAGSAGCAGDVVLETASKLAVASSGVPPATRSAKRKKSKKKSRAKKKKKKKKTKKKKKRKRLRLGRATIALAGGETKTIKVKLSSKARRYLRKKTKVKIRVLVRTRRADGKLTSKVSRTTLRGLKKAKKSKRKKRKKRGKKRVTKRARG